jgi:acyl carrier protein
MTFDPVRAADLVRGFVQRTIASDAQAVIANTEPLMTSGLVDSFALVDLLRFLEDTFQVHISEADLTPDRMNTIDMIVKHVEGLVRAG